MLTGSTILAQRYPRDSTIVYLLGAPGSGKSTLASRLRNRLEGWVVLDWDYVLDHFGKLAGVDVRATPELWGDYDDLLLATVSAIIGGRINCVVVGVRTPQELSAWPIDAWLLLDCSDSTRAARLEADGRLADVDGAVADAAKYRALGLGATIETSGSPDDVAKQVEEALGRAEARFREI